jgi:hydroxylaminobenzene mutase
MTECGSSRIRRRGSTGAWREVRLPSRWNAKAYWLALSGTYGNWASTTLAAIFGTAAMTPIAAGEHAGQRWQEAVVTFGFISTGLAILAAAIILLVGFRRQG